MLHRTLLLRTACHQLHLLLLRHEISSLAHCPCGPAEQAYWISVFFKLSRRDTLAVFAARSAGPTRLLCLLQAQQARLACCVYCRLNRSDSLAVFTAGPAGPTRSLVLCYRCRKLVSTDCLYYINTCMKCNE